MIKQVPGEKRKRSFFSTFLSLVNLFYSITALVLKLVHSLRKKNGPESFLPQNYLSLGPYRKVSYQLDLR